MREVDLAIVGGGPAGLAAAREAAEAGVEAVLIEGQPTMGGQFYRQVPDAFSLADYLAEGDQYSEGLETIRKVQSSRVEVMPDTLVWSIFNGRTLATYRQQQVELLAAKHLILAPGAQEVPVAFPGWTLPGVMLGGAVQSLLVSQRVLPGEKVIMAGVGPLQLKVASELLGAGAQVVAILDASSKPPVSMENALKSLGHWGKMREGLEYWLKLKRAGVPYYHRHVPVKAIGKEELEAVAVAEVDDRWRVVPNSERVLEADTLCLSYGFLPSVELSRFAGCRLAYDEHTGGWLTWHDGNQQTSTPGVYVAGEVGGIGGADVALEEGRIAAVAAARALGVLSADDRRQQEERARKRLAEARKFAAVTGEMMRLKPGLFDLMSDDTIICRCEEVTAGEVREAIANGAVSLRGVKIETRAGMGLCQGKVCGSLVSRLLAAAGVAELAEVGIDTRRPPVKPIPLSALAARMQQHSS